MAKVKIYTTPMCPYCVKAKDLLSSIGFQFDEIDVSSNQELRTEMSEKYHWNTVPMILIDDQFVGGYDDLAKLHAEGKLIDS